LQDFIVVLRERQRQARYCKGEMIYIFLKNAELDGGKQGILPCKGGQV
jgi:hypothetical protein